MSKSIILQREDGTGYIAVFLAQDSEAVAVGNGFDNYTQDHNDGQIRNAFAHTHKSAEILFNYDRTLAETLGNWKEDTPLTIDEADEYRDQYNNELGRKLAEYLNTWLADEDLQGRTYTDAEKEGFLDDLVYDAYVSGDMIWDLENDPRITIDSFESDPSQYQTPAADVIWTDPTANWQESSANRNYSHVDDFNENPIGFALALPEVAAAYANNTYNSLQELLTEVYSTASDWVNALPSWYTNTITWFGVTFAGAWDPLVIDLDGDGVQADYIEATFTNGGFTRVNPVNFDLDADGFAESATWHGDGFLVRDLNGNGRIDNGGELFGNASADGFTMLAQYDDNLDGVINAQDAIWGDLQIWHDANADAKTQASELISLSSLDITGIDLSAVATGSTNDLTHTGTVYTGTGTLEAGNYNFITEAANTRYAQNYDFDIRAAFLPTLRGYNQLPDLHIALSLDNDETNPDSLMAIILDIASYSFTEVFENWDTVKGKIEDLLYRWAGVENVLQNSRGDFIADARQLEFLEAHLGDQFIDNNGWGGNPQSVQALEFQDLWETQIFPRLAGAVLLQTQASKLTGSSITYDFADDDLVGTNVIDQLVLDQLVTAAIALPDTASREAFWLGVGELLAFSTGATDGGELLGYSETEQLKLKTAIENSDSSLTWDMADHDPLNGITSIEYRLFNPSGETITGDENDNSYYSDPVYGGTANDDTIYGLGGNDVLLGGLGSDAIYGGTGNDELYGQGGNDILDGGDGNDILAGGGGDAMDTVIGGAGNDILRIDSYTGGGQVLAQGGDGDDTYEVGREAWLDETTGSGLDTIILNSSQSEATLIYERHGDDMQVWLNSGFFTIRDHFNHGPVPIENITFENGDPNIDLTTFSQEVKTYGTEFDDIIHGIETGASTVDVIEAGDGDDEIYAGVNNDYVDAGDGNDIIDGGDGNDELRGQGGADTYIVSAGHDTVVEANNQLGDDLKFNTGTTFGDLSFSVRTLDNLNTTTITHALGTVTISNQFIQNANRIEELHFDDGIVQMSDVVITTHGTEGDDTITGIVSGASENDIIYGLGGNDTINSNNGNDTIYGGDGFDDINSDEGNDIIYGGNDNDTIDASGGDDILHGDAGNDTLNAGAGNDSLYGGDGDDTLKAFDSIGSIESDILDGGAGNDFLQGGAGDDTYYYSSGMDIVSEYGGNDALIFDPTIHIDNLDFIRDGYYAKVILDAGTDEIRMDNRFTSSGSDEQYRVDTLVFNDGFTLNWMVFDEGSNAWINNADGTANVNIILGDSSANTLHAYENDDTIYGRAGNDILYGDDGNDQVHGGDGNDILYGGLGNDKIWGGEGIDTASFSSSSTSVTVDLLVGTASGEGTDTLYTDIENIEGSAFADTLTGDLNRNVITGGAGDDVLNAGANDDTYIFNPGDGQDTISDASGADDLIRLGAGFTQADIVLAEVGTYDLEITFTNSPSDKITILGHRDDTGTKQIEKLVFADGSAISLLGPLPIQGSAGDDVIAGTAEDDVIQALDGDDTLSGGAGDDTLHGGSGTDTYLWQDGDGDDMLSDSDGNRDVISLGSGLRPDDLVFTETGSHDLQITFASATGSLTLLDQRDAAGTQQIERIRFDDGSELDLLRYQDWVFGTTGNDTITGDNAVDDIQIGLEGNDKLYAYSGNDILLGGAGNDKLYASTGNDELYGGDGDDNLYGSTGTTTIGDILVGGYGKDAFFAGYGDTIFYDVLPIDAAVENPQLDGSWDTFNGGAGDDTFIIQVGSNMVWGKDGDDTYKIYFMTDGTPTINFINEMSGADELILPDLDYNDPNWYFTYDPQYADRLLLIYSTAAGDTKIQVNNHFAGYDAGGDAIFGINTFTFGDGTSFDFLQHEVTAGTAATETIYGTAGKDYIVTYAGGDTVYAGDEDDYVRGGIDNDTLHGEAGQDFLFGYSGDDTVYGGLGDDRINGEDGADTLYGEEGIDIIRGGTGTDYLSGGVGNDTLYGEHDNDTIFGNEGRDKLYGSVGDDLLYGDGDGSETYAGERDMLYGHNGNDTLYGGGGSDYLYGERDDDIIYGGDDNDFIYGEKANNTTWNGNDTLYGGAGNDYIYGNKGTDVLYGQDGADNLWGNAGADTFVFELASAFSGVDNLQDFTVVDGDKLDLSELLTAYDPITDTITDFVQITDAGADSTLSVDMDGGADNFVQIATFKSLTGLDVQYLENNGNLLAA